MRSDWNDLSHDADFLRDYLLDRLTEKEADTVERRLLEDDRFFELAEAVEEDLLAAYAQDALAEEERARVARRLAASPRAQARYAIIQGITQIAEDRPTAPRRPDQPQPRGLTRAWLARSRNSGVPSTAAAFTPLPAETAAPRFGLRIAALAAGLLAVVGGVWLSQQTAVPHGALVAQGGNTTAQAIRHARGADTPPPALTPVPPALPQQGKAGQTGTAERPEPGVPAPPRTAPAAAPTPSAPPALFLLALDTVRGSSERPTLTIPPEAQRIEIQLPIQEGDEFPSYRAALFRGDGDTALWQGELKAHTAPGGTPAVTLALKAARLPQGTYRMELRGLGPDGQSELVGQRRFDVRTGPAELK
jgi:hypothetical protein